MRLASLSLLFIFFVLSCVTGGSSLAPTRLALKSIDPARLGGDDACVLLYDLRAERLVATFGETRCRKRMPACSTFKMPLALMAFDAGILRDETTTFKWDGIKRPVEAWNHDQTAKSWIRHSTVWVSQRITPLLGGERLAQYLKKFDYGNQDLSAGITSAWLTRTKENRDRGVGSLQISAYEQLEFQKRFWHGQLPVSADALAKTKGLVEIETSAHGYVLSGKTGSGYLDDLSGDFGWFVGRVARAGEEFAVVSTFTRKGNAADKRFPGLVARDRTIEILGDEGLW